MSRRMRRVPPGWEHPRDHNGHPKPLFEGPYAKMAEAWDAEEAKWNEDFIRDHFKGGWEPRSNSQIATDCPDFVQWHGERPQEEDYMPDFPLESRTHFQMYEETSEGTPISPVCASPEELAAWLVDNHADAWSGMGATYQEWLAMCRTGMGTVGLLVEGDRVMTGVEAAAEILKDRTLH